MKIRYIVAVGLAALLLGGCATYGYRGGSGDYYYDRSSTGYYGAPYGSVGYGSVYGAYGSVGYGYPGYARYGDRYGYGSRYYGYPSYGYYPGAYYGRPIVVRPRPDHNRPPRESRPNSPWRNLQGVTRVEHRERAQRIGRGNTAGPRPQSQRRERIQQSNPSTRPSTGQSSRSSPWRAGPSQQRSSQPNRSRPTPAATRQSVTPARQNASPRPARRPAPASRSRDGDRHRTIEP
ncbi:MULTISPECIES: hypothetical protein [unclassified Luteimonas]